MNSFEPERVSKERLESSEKADAVIVQHACMAGGATLVVGMIPFTTGLDLVFSIPILYGMYTRINASLNVAFSKHKVQSVAKMVGANLLGNVAAFAIAKIVAGFGRLIPGAHFLAGAIDATTNGVIMYVAGKVYKQLMMNLSQSGRAYSDIDLTKEMVELLGDKKTIKAYAKEGRKALKGRDFGAFKDSALQQKSDYENDRDLQDD